MIRRVVSAHKTSVVPDGGRLMGPGIFLSRHHDEDRLPVRVHWNDQYGNGQRKWFPAGRISDSSGNRLRVAYGDARLFREQYLLFREKGRLALFNPDCAPYSMRVLGILVGNG